MNHSNSSKLVEERNWQIFQENAIKDFVHFFHEKKIIDVMQYFVTPKIAVRHIKTQTEGNITN